MGKGGKDSYKSGPGNIKKGRELVHRNPRTEAGGGEVKNWNESTAVEREYYNTSGFLKVVVGVCQRSGTNSLGNLGRAAGLGTKLSWGGVGQGKGRSG